MLNSPREDSVKSYRTLPLFPTFRKGKRKQKFPFRPFFISRRGFGLWTLSLVATVLFSWTHRKSLELGQANSLTFLQFRVTRSHFTGIVFCQSTYNQGLYSFQNAQLLLLTCRCCSRIFAGKWILNLLCSSLFDSFSAEHVVTFELKCHLFRYSSPVRLWSVFSSDVV